MQDVEALLANEETTERELRFAIAQCHKQLGGSPKTRLVIRVTE